MQHGTPPACTPRQAAWFELAREVQLLGTCSHPCLLPLLGFCLDPAAACLVYPLMEGGSLEDRLLLDHAFPRRSWLFTSWCDSAPASIEKGARPAHSNALVVSKPLVACWVKGGEISPPWRL